MLRLLAVSLPGMRSCRLTFSVSAAKLAGFRIDRSRVPRLEPEDLEEKFVRGSGPGGQAVNRTNNAVFLKHIPTGLWVKCHESRSVERNRQVARQQLLTKLDNLVNGELSVENQERARDREIQKRRKEATRLKYELRRSAAAAVACSDGAPASPVPSAEEDSTSCTRTTSATSSCREPEDISSESVQSVDSAPVVTESRTNENR